MLELLFILTILTTITSDNDKWFIWRQEDKQITERIIRENLDLFDFLPDLNGKSINMYLDNFHIIDIDKDNDLDIIYSGWSGGESRCIRFYLNKNGKYSSSAFIRGDPTVIRDESNDFIMDVNLPGCCGDFEIRDFLIKTFVYKDSLSIKFLEERIHHESTKPPSTLFEKPINFKVTRDHCSLRVTPENSTSHYYFPSDEATNIYIIYRYGNEGIALGQKTDKTGRIWWYVEMDATLEQTGSDYKETGILPKYLGWMNSGFLKRIE
jgi:hypothetical protein